MQDLPPGGGGLSTFVRVSGGGIGRFEWWCLEICGTEAALEILFRV